MELRFEIFGRQETLSRSGCCGSLTSTINLRGEFLPSTIGTCSSTGQATWPGLGFLVLPWESRDLQWLNPTCDGYPTPFVWGNNPDNLYWVSDEMWQTNPMMASGATSAGSYWTGVGQAVNYPTLHTDYGFEVGVYPSSFLESNVAGRYHPESNQVWLNHEDFPSFTEANWAWLTAHELGHAIGFGHGTSFDHSRTIMMNGGSPGTDLTPRKLEKCGAVRAYPTPLQQ